MKGQNTMNKNKLNFLKYGLLITTPIPFVSIASSCNNNSNNQNTNVNEQEKIDKAANATTCEYRVDKTNVKATEAQSNQIEYKNINNSIKTSQVSLPQIEYHNFDQKLYKVVYITNKADDDEGTLNVTFRLVSLSNPKLESKQ